MGDDQLHLWAPPRRPLRYFAHMGPEWWPALAAGVARHMHREHELGGRVAAALATAQPPPIPGGVS